jgi:cation:H+ antiporter
MPQRPRCRAAGRRERSLHTLGGVDAFFSRLGLWGNVGAFALAALMIFVAGSKLEHYADRIGRRTRLGQLFAGMLLLAVATSLPEVATSATAALRGEVQLAVNNLLGGVIVQTMVLAAVDAAGSGRALTGRTPSFGLLIQGVGLVLLLAVTAGIASLDAHWKDVRWFSAAGPNLIVLVYFVMQYVTMRTQANPRWMPARGGDESSSSEDTSQDVGEVDEGDALARLLPRFLAAAVIVCVAGWLVVVCTERIAEATGASTSVLGFTVVAFATSLPEISTTLSAARRGHGLAAASNIFGSNAFDVALLGLVAGLAQGPIFAGFLIPSVFAASMGSLLTGIYLLGMLERQDRTIARMGWDSAAVLLLGFAGISVMFLLVR